MSKLKNSACAAATICAVSILFSYWIIHIYDDPTIVTSPLYRTLLGQRHLQVEKHSSIRDTNIHIANMCQNDTVRNLLATRRFSGASDILNYGHAGVCYCKVPKAASTHFVRTLLLADNPNNASSLRDKKPSAFHAIRLTKSKNVSKCPDATPFSFFVTRDPYSRLFSGYIDKIYLDKFWKYSINIQSYSQNYPGNLSMSPVVRRDQAKATVCKLSSVSFQKFLQFIVEKENFDAHFAPVTSLCDPCLHNYDAILKQERMKTDLEELAQHFNHVSSLLSTNVGDKDDTDTRLANILHTFYLNQYHRQVKHKCQLTHADTFRLHRRVWSVMKILGFVSKDEPFPHQVFRSGALQRNTSDLVFRAFKQASVEYLSGELRDNQRNLYLRNAYLNINSATIARIQEKFSMDFLMFKYSRDLPLTSTMALF